MLERGVAKVDGSALEEREPDAVTSGEIGASCREGAEAGELYGE
jgi:hypothetical protein